MEDTCYILEYIWIDVFDVLRSKTRVTKINSDKLSICQIPKWTYDGSSKDQSEGHNSDVVLVPCALYNDPLSINF